METIGETLGKGMEQYLRGKSAEEQARLTQAYLRGRSTGQAPLPLQCPKCLGLGGHDPYVLHNVGWVFGEYCDCAAGLKHKDYDASKAVSEDSIKAWVWHGSGVPKRLYGADLDSGPHRDSLTAQAMRFPPEARFLSAVQWHEAIAAWRWSWYLWGPLGVGKTGLAVGYMREWIWGGQGEARFITVPNLMAEIRATYGPPREGKQEEADVVYRYASVPLLVLDDLGSERITDANAEWVQDVFLRIIGNRHDGMMTTVFTSNYSLEALEGRLSERLAWRILAMCNQGHVAEIDGANLRAA